MHVKTSCGLSFPLRFPTEQLGAMDRNQTFVRAAVRLGLGEVVAKWTVLKQGATPTGAILPEAMGPLLRRGAPSEIIMSRLVASFHSEYPGKGLPYPHCTLEFYLVRIMTTLCFNLYIC